MKRISAILALAIVLAFPTSALAASATGVVSETLVATASVSATIPTSANYSIVAPIATATIPITGVSSTFSGGLTLRTQVNANSTGFINTANRAFTTVGAGWTASNLTYGQVTNNQQIIASTPGDVTGSSVTITSNVNGINNPISLTGTINIEVRTVN